MKLIKRNFIIFYQIIVFVKSTQSDHVQLIRQCSKEQQQQRQQQQQCLKNLDERLTEIIVENMENTTEPCEHFWNYACGSWTSAPYYDHVDNFGAMANYYADNLIETLTKLHAKRPDLKELVEPIMKYFWSCKSMEIYNLNMAVYLKELPIYEIFGDYFSWPHLFQDNVNIWQNFNWLRAVAYLRKYGFKEIFLQETIGFAWNNSQEYVVQFKIPHDKIKFQNKYKILQIMQEFDLLFGSDNAKNYLKLAYELYNFDKMLMNLYKKYDHMKQDHFISLLELSHLASSIDWNLYFEFLLNEIPSPQTLIEFSGNFQYFQDLNDLIKQTPKYIQGSYILIRFCQYLMDIRPPITQRDCMLHTNVMFPMGVNYIYNRFLYKNRFEDEQILQTIFYLLKQEFNIILKENKFSLSTLELQYLQEKLYLMRLRIGNFPAFLPDINRYYSSVQLVEHNFYHNHFEMLKFRTLEQHQFLLGVKLEPIPYDADYINDDISQLRYAPYFIHQRNMLIVPMVFLQLPFHHYAQHPVFQMSLVGWIMAHELSHAFDTHGLAFDAWGNKNLLGLQLAHKPSYLSSVECLIKQSPAVSLNERMADVNGLQVAWQMFSHQFPRNDQIYGKFSLRKLFFINFAQFFCGTLPRPIGHDRDDVRVRHTVANMKEFAETFQCASEAKENPERKCYIWKN